MSKLTKATQAASLNLLFLTGRKKETLKALDEVKFATRSDLHKATGLRISTLCSALKSLEDEGWVRVAFDRHDPETNRRVAVYTTTADADYRILYAAGSIRNHWER